jgi:fatty-acyl-CoA synthase
MSASGSARGVLLRETHAPVARPRNQRSSFWLKMKDCSIRPGWIAFAETDLEQESRAVPAADSEDNVVFVAVGRPLSDTEIRIAGARGESLPERFVGEILVRSTSLAAGYYDEPEETTAVFRDGWLHTGDLGYLAEGALFITGRKKELIIKGGQNLIPSVIEEIAGNVPGLRTGAVAPVGVRSPELETELVCIVAETRQDPADHPALAESVRLALQEKGVAVDKVLLVSPKSLPRTTSEVLKRIAKVSGGQSFPPDNPFQTHEQGKAPC